MLKQLAILTLLFSWTITFAQEPIRYTTKQGLPSNHIYDIQEDADGFMWFATNRGLAKFDGETFKTFTIQDGLPNNDTWLLELDAQGKLWYFSKSSYQGYILNDSIYKLQTADKKVISPRYIYKDKGSISFYSAYGMQAVKENKIKSAGIYTKLNQYQINEKLLKETKKKEFYQRSAVFNPDNNGLALFSQAEIHFYNYNIDYITSIEQKLPDSYTTHRIDNRGSLYKNVSFNAFDAGFIFTNFKSKTAKYISFDTYTDLEIINYFKCKGLKNEIQVSIPGHLLIFNYDLEHVDSYSFPKIPNNRISYKDSNGNIWLADFTSGVTYIPNTHLQSNYYLQGKKTQKLGVINHQLIAGINNDGFYKYSKSKNSFEGIVKNIGSSNGEIYKIKSNPNYLISGLRSFEYTNNNVKQIELKTIRGSDAEKHYSFKDITHFNNIDYFVSANYIVEKENNKNKIKITKSGLSQSIVFNEELYFSGSDGLHRLEKDSLVKPFINSDLVNTPIKTMTASNDHLWVGTDGRGIYCYNQEGAKHLKDTDGLSVQRIIYKNNDLWLATQKGAIKVALNNDSIEASKIIDSFYEADGLLQNNTNDIYLEDNFLFAASDIGLAKLNLKSEIYEQPPKLYFKSQADTINFENKKRDFIAITFASQNYSNQENLKYEYRLLPNQSDWTSTASKALNFTNLSPDLYTIEVRGTDQHGNVGNIKKYLNVLPKWWQTKLALFCFGLLAICFLIALIALLKKRIRNKERNKAEQDKRLVGLELQALRSQMNPHFVHNSLNAIQYFIQRKEVELSEDYLVKFSKLIRLFFEYSRRQTIAIEEELELLTYYLEIEKLRFEEKLEFKITVSENIDQEEQFIPSMLLQPLLENAVNHGLFHKQGNGMVEVDFIQLDENTIKVTVKDDGIGIHKAKKIYKHSSKNYQSNSSAVLQERLDLLNLSKEWEISYIIEDRSNINNEEGTLVILTFKHLIV